MSSETVETVYGLMPSQLSCASLKDLCVHAGIQTGPFGSQLHQEDYVQNGTPIITVEHLGENRIVHNNLPSVSDEDKARLAKYVLKTGDIVFSRVGSVDRRALVQPAEDGWLFSGRCLRVRPNPDQLDAQWLSYFFGLPAFKNYIRGIAVGATMPSLNTKILSDVPVYFPDLSTQKAAAEVLAKIDDRITLLRETNTTLEAIAQALFQSWFVDFDPVHTKMHGRAPEGMDQATAALFPDSFEESALGAVPKGWLVERLSDVCSYLNRGISPKYLEEGGVMVINQKCIREFSVDFAKARRHDSSQRKVDGRQVEVGDILVNSTGVGTLGRVAQVLALREVTIVDSHVTVVRAGKKLSWSYLGQWMVRKQPDIEAMGEGSTGQTELARSKLAMLPILVPSVDALKAFDALVKSLKERIAVNETCVSELAKLRDTLLPRLISGQLRIEEAAEALT
jgi:type I restriction enzyme S subunit